MKEKVRSLVIGWFHQYKNSDFLKRLSTLLIVDILVRISNIVLLPVYLRLMSQEEYGIYSYILSIVTTFSVLLNFGLYVPQSKYYADVHADEKRKVVLFNIFFCITALMVMIIIPLYSFGLDYGIIQFLLKSDINYPLYRWSILLALIVSAYSVILSNFFMISEKIALFRKYNTCRLVVVNITVLSSLFLFRQDKINTRLLYTYLIEMIIMLAFSPAYFREMLPRIDWKLIRSSLKLGLPVMISALWAMFSNNSDKFFIEKYGSSKELSCYYLAFSLSNLIIMVTQSVQNVWMPIFLKEKDLRTNVYKTKKLIIKLSAVLIVLSILLIIAFLLALKIGVISPDYTLTVYILPILLVGQTVNSALIIYVNYFIYLEKTHWSLLIGIATSLVSLAGSYYLVAVWNVFGAATVYLMVQLAYGGLYYAVIDRHLKARMQLLK